MQLLWKLIEIETAKFTSPSKLKGQRPASKTISAAPNKLQWLNPALIESILKVHRGLTVERDAKYALNYFDRPDLLAGYLAYYLPLNFFKIKMLLGAHSRAYLKDKSPLTIFDFGCGPATATLATLAFLKEAKLAPMKTNVHLYDLKPKALKMAERMVANFASDLELNVEIHTHQSFTRKTADEIGDIDLLLAANVLNEMESREELLALWHKTTGGFLCLEPSHRVSSQKLIRFREAVIEDAQSRKEGVKLLGPCLHTEDCPLYRTKHWCHFSEPTNDEFFKSVNLKIFKNPRLWLKFSYLYFLRASSKASAGYTLPNQYRAIGDVHQSGPGSLAIDLCAPKTKRVLKLSQNAPDKILVELVRGSLVQLTNDGKIFKIHPFKSK